MKGRRFGRWTVIGEGSELVGRTRSWLCRCACGKERMVPAPGLYGGGSRSCGCLKSERLSVRMTKHGLHGHPLEAIHDSMVRRCTNPRSQGWHRYGGRGISVCEGWRSLPVFHAWAIASGWRPGLQLDRIDNDGNYEPGNCRFVAPVVNANNKSNTIHVSAFGRSMSLPEWSRDPVCKVTLTGLSGRLKRGWGIERAITARPWAHYNSERRKNKHRKDGENRNR